MLIECVSAWDRNKTNLEEYFRTHKQEEYSSYKDLVKLLFDIIINPVLGRSWEIYDTDPKHIHEIDDGDYQGSLIFILHRNTYQPGVEDYVYTSVCYGSCSGCDTLLGINGYGDDLPNEEQIKDYMTLCLHLLQNTKKFKGEFEND